MLTTDADIVICKDQVSQERGGGEVCAHEQAAAVEGGVVGEPHPHQAEVGPLQRQPTCPGSPTLRQQTSPGSVCRSAWRAACASRLYYVLIHVPNLDYDSHSHPDWGQTTAPPLKAAWPTHEWIDRPNNPSLSRCDMRRNLLRPDDCCRRLCTFESWYPLSSLGSCCTAGGQSVRMTWCVRKRTAGGAVQEGQHAVVANTAARDGQAGQPASAGAVEHRAAGLGTRQKQWQQSVHSRPSRQAATRVRKIQCNNAAIGLGDLPICSSWKMENHRTIKTRNASAGAWWGAKCLRAVFPLVGRPWHLAGRVAAQQCGVDGDEGGFAAGSSLAGRLHEQRPAAAAACRSARRGTQCRVSYQRAILQARGDPKHCHAAAKAPAQHC